MVVIRSPVLLYYSTLICIDRYDHYSLIALVCVFACAFILWLNSTNYSQVYFSA